jgi:hypothetical protein
MPANSLELGKWWMQCDRCGFKRKNDEMAKEWTGLMVCKDTCYETRHPQDFVRGVPDKQSVSPTRPESADVFISVTYNSGVLAQAHNTVPSGTFNTEETL